MSVATFVLVALGAVIALAGLYYTARTNSLSAREKAIAAAREPLQREINDLRGEVADLKRVNERQQVRIEHLEDELRRRL